MSNLLIPMKFFESFAENKETKLLDDVIEGNAFTDSQRELFKHIK